MASFNSDESGEGEGGGGEGGGGGGLPDLYGLT